MFFWRKLKNQILQFLAIYFFMNLLLFRKVCPRHKKGHTHTHSARFYFFNFFFFYCSDKAAIHFDGSFSYDKRFERHERIVEFVQKQAKKQLQESGGNDFVTYLLHS